LCEDRSPRGLIAVKFFDSAVTQASDGRSAFFREIDAPVRLIHPGVVGCRLATGTSPAQVRTEFADGGSLPRLDNTWKAIVIVGVVVGMNFIRSRGAIH
jgi:hypothetical protein